MGASKSLKGGLVRLASGLAVAAATVTGPTGGAAADGIIQWSDTFAGVRYGTTYREPGSTEDIEKGIFQLGHVSGWTYGTNFFNLDILKATSESEEPNKDGDGSAQEIYFVARETLSSAKIFGFTYGGIISDVGLTLGTDLSYKNDAFNARVRKFVVGPTISFNVPGFAQIGVQAYFEHNNNRFAKLAGPPFDPSVDFDPTWRVDGAWGIPFEIGLPFMFKGFFALTGEKGDDAFGNATAAELLVETALLADIGPSVGSDKGMLYLGLGYQYWLNKFGNDPDVTGLDGTEASVPQLVAEFHF